MSSTQRKIRKYEEEAANALDKLFTQYVNATLTEKTNSPFLFDRFNQLWLIECIKLNYKSKGLVKISNKAFKDVVDKHYKEAVKMLTPKKTLLQKFLSIFKK